MTPHSNRAAPLFLFIQRTKLQGAGQGSIPAVEGQHQLLHLLIRTKETTDKTSEQNRGVNMAHPRCTCIPANGEQNVKFTYLDLWCQMRGWTNTVGNNCEQADHPRIASAVSLCIEICLPYSPEVCPHSQGHENSHWYSVAAAVHS